jgi:hypothetical protein
VTDLRAAMGQLRGFAAEYGESVYVDETNETGGYDLYCAARAVIDAFFGKDAQFQSPDSVEAHADASERGERAVDEADGEEE